MKKKLLSVVLAMILCLGLATTALAAEAKTFENEFIVISNVTEQTEGELNGYPCPALDCTESVEFKMTAEAAKLYVAQLTLVGEDGEDWSWGLTGQTSVTWDEPGAYEVTLSLEPLAGIDAPLDVSQYIVNVLPAADAEADDAKTETGDTENTGDASDTVFADVAADAYYALPVEWAVNAGVTKGVSNTKFAPEETCTRAQIITFLWRAAETEPGATAEIADVSSEDYYYEAVMWAKDMDMFEGDYFKPDEPCTRLAAVEFLWAAIGRSEARPADFSDVKSPAVDWAVGANVTTGTSAGVFSPDETCTRGQIVTLLWRAFVRDAGL